MLLLELTSRLAGSCSRFIEYVLASFDYDFLFDATRFGRVQTALKLSNKGQWLSADSSMAQYVLQCLGQSIILNATQIALEDTALDAAKSSIVFGVTKGVSTPGRAVRPHLIVVCYG